MKHMFFSSCLNAHTIKPMVVQHVKHFTQALYRSTLHKHFTKALYTSTLSKHFTQALYPSTLHKHFIQALYQSTLSKHFIQSLFQGNSKSVLEIPVKVLQRY